MDAISPIERARDALNPSVPTDGLPTTSIVLNQATAELTEASEELPPAAMTSVDPNQAVESRAQFPVPPTQFEQLSGFGQAAASIVASNSNIENSREKRRKPKRGGSSKQQSSPGASTPYGSRQGEDTTEASESEDSDKKSDADALDGIAESESTGESEESDSNDKVEDREGTKSKKPKSEKKRSSKQKKSSGASKKVGSSRNAAEEDLGLEDRLAMKQADFEKTQKQVAEKKREAEGALEKGKQQASSRISQGQDAMEESENMLDSATRGDIDANGLINNAKGADCFKNPFKRYKEKAQAFLFKTSVGILALLLTLAVGVFLGIVTGWIEVNDFDFVLLLIFISMSLLELLRERLAYLTDNNLNYQKLPARQFLCQPRSVVMSFLWIPAAIASGDRPTIYRVCCEALVSGTVLVLSLANEEFFFGEAQAEENEDFYGDRRSANGEQACEGFDWNEDACNQIGCCEWISGVCWSAIGQDTCEVSGTFACEEVEEWDEETCNYIGCCTFANGQCTSAVGEEFCRGFNTLFGAVDCDSDGEYYSYYEDYCEYQEYEPSYRNPYVMAGLLIGLLLLSLSTASCLCFRGEILTEVKPKSRDSKEKKKWDRLNKVFSCIQASAEEGAGELDVDDETPGGPSFGVGGDRMDGSDRDDDDSDDGDGNHRDGGDDKKGRKGKKGKKKSARSGEESEDEGTGVSFDPSDWGEAAKESAQKRAEQALAAKKARVQAKLEEQKSDLEAGIDAKQRDLEGGIDNMSKGLEKRARGTKGGESGTGESKYDKESSPWSWQALLGPVLGVVAAVAAGSFYLSLGGSKVGAEDSSGEEESGRGLSRPDMDKAKEQAKMAMKQVAGVLMVLGWTAAGETALGCYNNLVLRRRCEMVKKDLQRGKELKKHELDEEAMEEFHAKVEEMKHTAPPGLPDGFLQALRLRLPLFTAVTIVAATVAKIAIAARGAAVSFVTLGPAVFVLEALIIVFLILFFYVVSARIVVNYPGLRCSPDGVTPELENPTPPPSPPPAPRAITPPPPPPPAVCQDCVVLQRGVDNARARLQVLEDEYRREWDEIHHCWIHNPVPGRSGQNALDDCMGTFLVTSDISYPDGTARFFRCCAPANAAPSSNPRNSPDTPLLRGSTSSQNSPRSAADPATPPAVPLASLVAPGSGFSALSASPLQLESTIGFPSPSAPSAPATPSRNYIPGIAPPRAALGRPPAAQLLPCSCRLCSPRACQRCSALMADFEDLRERFHSLKAILTEHWYNFQHEEGYVASRSPAAPTVASTLVFRQGPYPGVL